MSRLTRWMDRRFYPKHMDNWDDELFRAEILRHLKPDFQVLDLGAGAGNVTQMNFRGECARVVGVDPSEQVFANPHLDEAQMGLGNAIPCSDASFDLVFSDNVLEHLENSVDTFREVYRVLRPGGVLLVKTPNFWHYMPLIASITPLRFHEFYNAFRGRSAEHTFPTLYRCTTPARIRECARQSGLEVLSHSLTEGRPHYLRVSGLTYWFGLLYERLVNASEQLARFRILLIATMRKP